MNDDDLTPGLRAKLEKLGATFDTMTSSASAGSKSLLNQIKQQKEEAEARKDVLTYLQKELNLSKTEADQVSKKIKRDADIAKATDAREARAKEMAEAAQKAANKVGDAFAYVASSASQIASSAMSAQQAAYMSKDIFTGASGTIDTFSSAAKAAVGALSGLVGMIPVVGAGMSKAMDAVTNGIIDLTVQSAKIQLERAQMVYNSMNELSKTGVPMAGNLTYLGKTAADAGMNITLYTDFIKQALPHLQRLGGTVAETSVRISKFGHDLAKGNSQLVVMYGGYDGYMSAIADYHARLASYGVDVSSNNKKLKESTLDYLKTQKALTELTGKSAEQYEKEARERQQNISWQSAMQSYGNMAPKIEQAMSVLSQYSGQGVAKAVQEAIANRTLDVRLDKSPENRMFINMFQQGQEEALNKFMRSATKGDMTGAAEALKDFAQKQGIQAKDQEQFIKDFLSITGVGNEALPGPMRDFYQSLSTSAVNFPSLEKMPEALKNLKDINVESKNSKELVDLMDTKIKLGQEIDKKVIDGIAKTIELTNELYRFQNLIVDKFPDFGSAVDKFVKAINDMIDKKGEEKNWDWWTHATDVTGSESEKFTSKKLGWGGAPIIGTGLNPTPKAGMAPRDLTKGPKGGKFGNGFFGGSGKSTVMNDFNTMTGPDGSKKEGEISQSVLDLMSQIDSAFPGTTFIAGAGKHTGGGHVLGRALDWILPKEYLKHYTSLDDPESPVKGANPKYPGKWDDRPSLADSEYVTRWMRNLGFTKSINEYAYPSPNATGGHFHAEFAKGGIVSPTSGGVDATVAEAGQTELIAPLKNGMIPGMEKLITAMQENLSVSRDTRDYLEKIHKSVA